MLVTIRAYRINVILSYNDLQLLDIVFVMEMFKQPRHSNKPQCNRF